MRDEKNTNITPVFPHPSSLIPHPSHVSRAWLRALELTAPIPRQRERVLPAVVDELGHRLGDKPALLSDRECFTYFQLAGRAAVRPLGARAERGQGRCGWPVDAQPPRVSGYLAGCHPCWRSRRTAQHQPRRAVLAHCIQAVSAKHLIVAMELADALDTALPHLAAPPQVWIHGGPNPTPGKFSIDEKIESLAAAPLEAGELREITIDDRALFIFTSGSTGMPKAGNVSHARVMQWGLWFAGMMDAQPSDRLYNCLPMYHSVGGVLAPGAMLAAGGSLVVREVLGEPVLERHHPLGVHRVSVHWRALPLPAAPLLCGERDRAPPSARVWQRPFGRRVGGIPAALPHPADPRVLRCHGGWPVVVQRRGQAGSHRPHSPYLAHRFAPALVAFDFDKGEPGRNENGFCIRCGVNEPGEAIVKVRNDPASAGSRFEGYTSAAETEKRILRHVFVAGDAWVRTGDLMRQDEKGFFYFVDRIGDTFRWKGENVASTEVAQALCAFEGILHASVFGVAIPGTEGRAGWRPSSATVRLISRRCTGISPSGCPPMRARFFFGCVRKPS